MKKLFILFILLLFIGCSSGVKKMRFSDGSPRNSITSVKPTYVTNTVELVKPAQTNKITVDIPIIVSKPQNSTNIEDIKVTIPKSIDINIKIPSSTNIVTLSGNRDNSFFASPAFFLYYFILIASVGIGWYIWNKNRCKNKKISLDHTPK